jgi:uncharacterized damage-inducible protein DinB
MSGRGSLMSIRSLQGIRCDTPDWLQRTLQHGHAPSLESVGDEAVDFPTGHVDDRELLLDWLRYLRSAVLRKLDGLSDEDARWRPDGALIPLLGIVNHLTHVEWRWIEGGIRGAEVERSEGEFEPGPELTLAAAISTYKDRAAATDHAVRSMPLDSPCQWGVGTDLRWVLIHLINETARHAGHADATRELLDGTTGE